MSHALSRYLDRLINLGGEPFVRKVHIPFSKTINVAAVSTAAGAGTGVIAGLPEGNIFLMGSLIYLACSSSDTDLSATYNGDFAVGTTANADTDLVDAGEANVIASTSTPAAVARAVARFRTAGVTTPVYIDNTDASLKLNLNLLVDAADIADDTNADILCVGDLFLVYAMLGDD